jgi:hypothetical protein
MMTLDEIDAAEAARRPPGVALPARARRSRTLPPAVISRRNRDEHDLALAHERLSDHEASYTRVKRKVGGRHVDRALPAPFAPISRVEEFVRARVLPLMSDVHVRTTSEELVRVVSMRLADARRYLDSWYRSSFRCLTRWLSRSLPRIAAPGRPRSVHTQLAVINRSRRQRLSLTSADRMLWRGSRSDGAACACSGHGRVDIGQVVPGFGQGPRINSRDIHNESIWA